MAREALCERFRSPRCAASRAPSWALVASRSQRYGPWCASPSGAIDLLGLKFGRTAYGPVRFHRCVSPGWFELLSQSRVISRPQFDFMQRSGRAFASALCWLPALS